MFEAKLELSKVSWADHQAISTETIPFQVGIRSKVNEFQSIVTKFDWEPLVIFKSAVLNHITSSENSIWTGIGVDEVL